MEPKHRMFQSGVLPPGTSAIDVAVYMHKITCPALDGSARLDADATIRNDLIPIVIALGVLHAENGEYPARALDGILPDHLSDLPNGPLLYSSLTFKNTANSYRLYSLGLNGKDDGGDYENSDEHDDLGLIAVPPEH